MDKIEKIKNDLVDKFKDQVSQLISSDLFSEVSRLQKDIDLNNEKLTLIKSEYDNANIELSKALSNTERVKSESAEYKKSLEEKEKDLSFREIKLSKKIEKDTKDTLDLVEQRNNLQSEIESLKKDISSYVVKKTDIDKLKEEEKEVKSIILNLKKEVDLLTIEKNNISSEVERSKVIAKKELDDIAKEREARLSAIMPAISEFETREKNLLIKEESLKTVIARYKRLFGEKGAGFRID